MTKFTTLPLLASIVCASLTAQAAPTGTPVAPPAAGLMKTLSAGKAAPSPEGLKPRVLKQTPARKPTDIPVALGNIVYSSEWPEETYFENIGVYSLQLTGDIAPAPLYISTSTDPNGGGVMCNGHYYFIHYYQYGDYIYPSYYKYDIDTWTLEDMEDLQDISLFTTTSTFDASTGKIYGVAYGLDHDGFDLATIDYDTKERKTIGALDRRYLCMAAAPAGQLYGISLEGKLYSIDKTCAQSTLIGDTGLRPANYFQSATFDLRNNRLYWAYLGEEGSGIYTLDTTTGKATAARLFDGRTEIMSLYIAPPEAAEEAPDALEDFKVTLDGPSLAANVSFRLPATTYGGTPLSGQLSYKVTAKGPKEERVKEGTGMPGELINFTFDSEPESVTFEARAHNAAGQGPAAKTTLWVGYDMVVANYADYNTVMNVDGNSVSFNWNAPTQSAHGGYVDFDNLKYIIRCFRDQQLISTTEPLTGTSYATEITDSSLAEYYWNISTVNGNASTEGMLLGHTVILGFIEPPFFDGFDDNTHWPFWASKLNSGGAMWNHNSAESCITLWGSWEPSDVWTMTPPLSLNKDKYYQVEFTYGGGDYVPTMLQAAMGQGNDPDKYTDILLDDKNIEGAYMRKFDGTFKANANALFRLGFHSLDPGEDFVVAVDSVRVSRPIDAKAPERPTRFTVTPGAKGALSATLGFTLPSKTADGSALSSIDHVAILRDEEWIADVTGATPGKKMEYTDDNAPLGRHHYRVAAVNAAGTGFAAEAQAHIGVAMPGNIPQIHVKDDQGHVTINWDLPEGLGGAYIDDNTVTYTVRRYLAGDTTIIAKNINLRECTDDIPVTGPQHRITYGITPTTAAGTGVESYSYRRISGAPHSLPFKESFPNAESTYDSWWHLSDDPYYPEYFTVTNEGSSDNDGGAIYLASFFDSGCTAWLNSGKIDIKGVAHPMLSFDYWLMPEYDIDLGVEISTNELDMLPVANYPFFGNAVQREWRHESIDLSDFAGAPYIVLHFRGETHEADVPCIIDNIRVTDATGVSDINADATLWPADVYSIDGRLVRRQAQSLDGLASGIYIVKGKKLLKK